MRVVILGATGNVGTSLVDELASDPGVDQIVAVAPEAPATPRRVRRTSAGTGAMTEPLAPDGPRARVDELLSGVEVARCVKVEGRDARARGVEHEDGVETRDLDHPSQVSAESSPHHGRTDGTGVRGLGCRTFLYQRVQTCPV